MSATSSSRTITAADLLAGAILDETRTWTADRRAYLSTYLGIEPRAVFDRVFADVGGETSVQLPRGGAQSFAIILRTSTAVLPYLVTDPEAAGQNMGSQGFAAYLRAADWEPGTGLRRVTLVFDPDPVETIRTAADDLSSLPAARWDELCRRAAAFGAPELRTFLSAVCKDFALRVAPDGAALDRLAAFCSAHWENTTAAASRLDMLGCYLADPPAAVDASRLATGARWRDTLERWMLPGEDIRRQLGRRLGPQSRGTAAVLRAMGPLGLDFNAFALDDLDSSPAPPRHLRFQRPLHVDGATAFAAGNSLTVHLTAGSTFDLRLTGERSGDELAATAPAGAASATVHDGRRVSLDLRSPGWTFYEVSLRTSSRDDSVVLACYAGAENWFPVERSLAIDVQAEAFVCEGEPRILAVGAGGRVLGPAAIQLDSAVEPGTVTHARATFSGVTIPIPLMLVGEPVPPPGPEPAPPSRRKPAPIDPEPGNDPTGGGEGPDGTDRAGDGRGYGGPGAPPPLPTEPDPDVEDPAAPGWQRDEGEVPSVVHALLAASRQGGQARRPTFSSAGGQAHVNLEGTHYTIGPDQIGLWTGPQLETQILLHPHVLAFSFPTLPDDDAIQPAREIERLSLQNLDPSKLAAFLDARSAFFAALLPFGSVHAVGAGLATGEAERYCAAYSSLLRSVVPSERYQPEFDRLLLIDAVVDYASGDILLAPTNPATVAFLLCFQSAAQRWQEAGIPPEKTDIDSVGPRHLLPMFFHNERWHESLPDQPFLWRRFRPMVTAGIRAEHDPAFIASRLLFFLEVHPAYKDPRQRIAVAFHDPGDGQAVSDALVRYYDRDAAPDKLEFTLPALDLYLLGTGGEVPAALEDLLTSEPDDATSRQLARSRIRMTVIEPGEQQPFCHLSFVFRSPAERHPWPVGLDDRAPTTFVGGLATSPGRAVLRNANELAFAWGTFGGKMAGEAGDSRSTELLAGCTVPCLELVGGQPREAVTAGRTRMPTTRVAPGFLPAIYARSTWVVHLDRLLGLDAFSPAEGDGPQRYLIDYEEGADPTQPGLDSITATERVEPYLESISRALADLNPSPAATRSRILHLLNAVSGKWALQLLRRSPEQVRERIGTVAAIAALQELDGAFNQTGATGLLVPLDELLAQLGAAGAAARQSPTCDDLLYLRVPHDTTNIAVSARLIEVKYRTTGTPDLKVARAQLDSITACLRAAVDPTSPSALFRSRDLAEIIRVAASRGMAFGLATTPMTAIEPALKAIASGDYRLDFSYKVGADCLRGDVISIEASSTVAAARIRLPGDGAAYGLVRLGRPALQRLANGQAMDVPTGWQVPVFEPCTPGAGTAPAYDATRSPVGDKASVQASGPTAATVAPATGPAEQAEQRRAEAQALAAALDAAALKYNLELEPFNPDLVQVGPSVVRLRTRPLGKQSLAGVQRRALDLGREVGVAEGVLVDQEPYYLTVDVPRQTRDMVTYAQHAHLLDAEQPAGSLPFLVGMAPSGETRIADLARLPHLLVAGATGSGKSVLLRGLVSSLVRNRSHEQFRILIVDPKQVDFLPFEDLPHLAYGGIVTDPHEAIAVLRDMIETEIGTRRPKLKEAGVTSVLEFYESGGSLEDIPQTVVLVDEFADLAASLSQEDRGAFFQLIQRYGQVTRAFGIYLVLATQRPSVQVINGDIKANLTARIALKVQASQDSVTILGRGGAERLRDRGDMLFDHGGNAERLQGFYASPADAREAVRRATMR